MRHDFDDDDIDDLDILNEEPLHEGSHSKDEETDDEDDY